MKNNCYISDCKSALKCFELFGTRFFPFIQKIFVRFFGEKSNVVFRYFIKFLMNFLELISRKTCEASLKFFQGIWSWFNPLFIFSFRFSSSRSSCSKEHSWFWTLLSRKDIPSWFQWLIFSTAVDVLSHRLIVRNSTWMRIWTRVRTSLGLIHEGAKDKSERRTIMQKIELFKIMHYFDVEISETIGFRSFSHIVLSVRACVRQEVVSYRL